MRIYLDDTLIDEGDFALAEAVDKAVTAANGRPLVEATADGSPIAEADLADPPARTPYAGEMRFVSTSPAGFALDATRRAAEILEDLEEEQARVGEALQTGELTEATAGLGRILGSWEFARDTLNRVRMAGVDLDAETDAAVDELATRLRELRDHLGGGDWVGVSDLLVYDMNPLAARWRAALDRAGARLAEREAETR